MKRAFGLFLFASGLLFGALGLMMGVAFLAQTEGGSWEFSAMTLGGGVLGVLVAALGLRIIRRSRPLDHIPAKVEGRVGSYLVDAPEKKEADGRSYERLYRQPVRGKSGLESSLVVRVPVATPVALQFDRETWFDKACKAVRINREYQTGDAEFDAAVYVRGPGGRFTETYLSDPAKRLAIRELLAAGYERVRLTSKFALAEWPKFDPTADHSHSLTDEAAVHLHTLAAKLSPASDGGRERGTDSLAPPLGLVLLWLFLIAWAFTAVAVFLYPPVRLGDWLIPAGVVFVIGFPMVAWVAALVYRGKSDSHDNWAKAVGVGLFLFAAGSVGIVGTVNGLPDSSPPMERTLSVVGKETSRGRRGGTNYHVLVPAWDGSNGTNKVNVSSDDYNRVVPRKSQVRLTTGRGTLGIEWVRRKQVEP